MTRPWSALVEFADFVAEHSDPLSQRFAESLRRWATEKAGTSASATNNSLNLPRCCSRGRRWLGNNNLPRAHKTQRAG